MVGFFGFFCFVLLSCVCYCVLVDVKFLRVNSKDYCVFKSNFNFLKFLTNPGNCMFFFKKYDYGHAFLNQSNNSEYLQIFNPRRIDLYFLSFALVNAKIIKF